MAKYRYKVTKDNMKEVFDHIIEFLQCPTKYRKPHKGDDSNNGNEISLIAPKIRYEFYSDEPKIIITDLLLGNQCIEITGDGDNVVEIDASRIICIYNMCDHMVGYKTKIIDEHEAYMSHSFRRVSRITNDDISKEISRLICGHLSTYYKEAVLLSQTAEKKSDVPEFLKFEMYVLEELIRAVQKSHWAFRDDVNRLIHISLINYHMPGDAFLRFDHHPYIKHLSEDAPRKGYDIAETLTYLYTDNVNCIRAHNPSEFLYQLEDAFNLRNPSDKKSSI